MRRARSRGEHHAVPSATVFTTAPTSVRPRSHEFAERERKRLLAHRPLRLEVEQRRGSPARRRRSAGTGRPSARAGPADIRSSSVASGTSPVRTRYVLSAANAVSSPVTPNGASSNGTSFSCRACGAWSVATQSIVPSSRPSTSARAVVLGAQRRVHLHVRRRACARARRCAQRWCGLASALTATPLARARRTASTDSRAERCCRCTGRVLVGGEREVALDHQALGDRRPAGEPELGGDRALVHLPAARTASAPRSGARAAGRRRRCTRARAASARPTRRACPSSVNATAPGGRELGHLGQLLPALALRDRGHEPGRHDRLLARLLDERLRARRRVSTTGSVFGIATIAQ